MFVDSDFNISVSAVQNTLRLVGAVSGGASIRKNRERWSLALKTKGKTFYTVHGKTILSDALHPVLLPKGSTYIWKCVEPGECILIEFDAPETCDEVLAFSVSDNTLLLKNCAKIEKLLNEASQAARMEAVFYLYESLLFLIKSSKKPYTPKDKNDILSPAVSYMNACYSDKGITNDRLAALCKISTVYFRQTFEKVYGISPIKYLNYFRIKKAEAMLLSDYESVGQIAESVGYNSIYHFSKMFKLYTGVSPSEYKKAHHC